MIEFVDVNDLFDVDTIDNNITFDDFLKLRKNENIPIEDYILMERYSDE